MCVARLWARPPQRRAHFIFILTTSTTHQPIYAHKLTLTLRACAAIVLCPCRFAEVRARFTRWNTAAGRAHPAVGVRSFQSRPVCRNCHPLGGDVRVHLRSRAANGERFVCVRSAPDSSVLRSRSSFEDLPIRNAACERHTYALVYSCACARVRVCVCVVVCR